MDNIIMVNVLIFATLSDLKDYKIKNPIIVFGWISAVCLRGMQAGICGFAKGIICIIVPVIVCWPLFITGGIGAGDIKLLSVISGIYGIKFLGRVSILLLIFAGAISLLYLIKKKMLVQRVKRFIFYLTGIMHGGGVEKYYQLKRDGTEFAIPLAPVTAAAYFLAMILYR